MKLGTHVPDSERRKPIDNEVCRTKVKVTTYKNRTKIQYFFRLHFVLKILCGSEKSIKFLFYF
jgi:hypothetical protein